MAEDTQRGSSRPDARPKRQRPREVDWIGKKLNQVYGESLDEPIPADLMDLIKKIGDSTNGSSK